jgi:hypothetical protein
MFCCYIIPSNLIIGKIDINIKADESEGVLIDKGGKRHNGNHKRDECMGAPPKKGNINQGTWKEVLYMND